MINRLKRRVFWSILLSAAGVLLAILIAINIVGLAQTASKMDSVLDSALMMLQPDSGTGRGHGGMPGGGKGRGEFLRSASAGELGLVLFDAQGDIAALSGCADQLTDEDLSSIAAAVLINTRARACGWEYKAISLSNGTAVSILNAASLRSEDIGTALLSLAGFAAAFCLFALVARLLSRAIVKPVEENMQMQKRFIADASHELKTPLSVIDANASVLEQSAGSSKWLDYIKEQTGRMSSLVNELLQLSNLEEAKNTKQPAPREPFDAAEAVLTAALPFESVAFERNVSLETDSPDTLPVHGSRQDLEQLAAILIDNAVKHSDEGGTVRVSLSASTSRHAWKEQPVIELRVSNTGDVIPPEALPHIFERFYKADSSRTHKDNSYGLGLAIAKSLAERNGGTITVRSDNGVTEFTAEMGAG